MIVGKSYQNGYYREMLLLTHALLGDALNKKKESCQSLWLTRFSLFYGYLFSVIAFNIHFSDGISHFRHTRKRKAMHKYFGKNLMGLRYLTDILAPNLIDSSENILYDTLKKI